MTRSLIGERFLVRHAAGETEYEVKAPHPFDAGYFECTAVRAASGSHHCLGALQIVHRGDIVRQQTKVCGHCGGTHPGDRSCDCFDNGCQARAAAW